MFGVCSSSSFVTPPISTSLDSIRENTVWNGTLSTAVCVFVGALCKGMMGVNNFEIKNQNRLLLSLDEAKTSRTRGVLTASNHVSTIDDPVGIVSLIPFTHVMDVNRLRWTLGAKDILFTNRFNSRFFSLGQVISTERGGGLFQQAIHDAVARLNRGRWVHIFPEGRINMEPDKKVILPMKPGIGKIVMKSNKVPIIIPIYFHNLQNLLSEKSLPRVGQHVQIFIGEPINVEDIINEYNSLDEKEQRLQEKYYYLKIANRVGSAIEELAKTVKE